MVSTVYGAIVTYGCFCFIGVILFTTYLLWQYARPGTPLVPLFLTWLSWIIVFSICFLVPMDLIPTFQDSLDTVWTVLFWASFLLMWIIIPFASGYYDNGGFTVKHKLWMSVKFNLLLITVVGVIAIGGIIYLTAYASWSTDDITSLLVCASNTWGLTMLVLCAGFGLVEVPRTTYYQRDYKRRQDQIYYFCANIHDEQERTWDELALTIKTLDSVENKINEAGNEKHRRWMVEIRNVVREREIQLEDSKKHCHPVELPLISELKSSKKITTNHMFKLHAHTKTLVKHLSLVETQWRDTVDDAVELEKELAQQSDPLEVSWWFKTGKRQSYYVAAILGTILSVLIVIGEITIPASSDVSPLGWLVKLVQNNFVLQQIFTAVPFLYLSICAYYPLFQIRLSKLYYIGRKRTDELTLLFNATFMLRVSVPLAYNFVLLLQMPASALVKFVGVVTNIPFFGVSFTTYFPVFIIVLNVLVFFRIFDRIGSCLGMEDFKFNIVDRVMNDEIKDKMQEGRTLIQSELNKRSKEKRNQITNSTIKNQAKQSHNGTTQQHDIETGEEGEYYDENEEYYEDENGEEYYEETGEENKENTTAPGEEEEEDEEHNMQLNQNSYAGAAYAQYALQQAKQNEATKETKSIIPKSIIPIHKAMKNVFSKDKAKSSNTTSNPATSNDAAPTASTNNNTSNPSSTQPLSGETSPTPSLNFKPVSQRQQTRNFNDAAKFASPSSRSSVKFSFNYTNALNSTPVPSTLNSSNTSNNNATNNKNNKPQPQEDEGEEQFDDDGNLTV